MAADINELARQMNAATAPQGPVDINALAKALNATTATGQQNIQTPAAPQEKLLERPQLAVAQHEAGRRMAGQEARDEQLIQALAESMQAAEQQPAAAERLGLEAPTLWDKTKEMLGEGLHKTGSALEIVGAQLDRPFQGIAGAVDALEHGGGLGTSVGAGLNAATGYGWRNPHRISGERLLEQAGLEEGRVFSSGTGVVPRITQRGIAGFGAEMLADPFTWLGGKSAELLGRFGVRLSNEGSEAFRVLQRVVHIADDPDLYKLLQTHGYRQLGDEIERIAPAVREVLAAPTPEKIAKLKPRLMDTSKRVVNAVNDLTLRDKLYTLDEAGKKVPFQAWSDILQERAAESMNKQLVAAAKAKQTAADITEALKTKNVELMRAALAVPEGKKLAWEDMVTQARAARVQAIKDAEVNVWKDPGGLYFGAGKHKVNVLPAAPIKEAVGGALNQAGKAIAENFPKTAERVKSVVDPITDALAEAGDAVGRTFNTVWGLPAEFAARYKHDFRAVLKMHEYNIKRKIEDEIFKGLALSDRQELIKAIDARKLGDLGTADELFKRNPQVKSAWDKMVAAQNEVWRERVKRGLIAEDQFVPDYFMHYYNDSPRHLTAVLTRQGRQIKDARSLDPSNYQRVFKTYAEAEAAGLHPEYDAAKLLSMHLMNGWRSVVAHDFMKDTVARFGKATIPDAEAVLRAAADAEGETVKHVASWQQRVLSGTEDLNDTEKLHSAIEGLVAEGKTGHDVIRALPDEGKRLFFEARFNKAMRGSGREVLAAKNKYKQWQKFWPGGPNANPGANALGLPKLPPLDGQWFTVHVPRVGTTVLPERIVRKLQELSQTSVFNSPAGEPMRWFIRNYNRWMLNPWRKVTTSIFPQFHVRNFYTNVIQSGADIGLAVLDAQTRAEANVILRASDKGVVKLRDGRLVRGDQLLSEFIRYGGMNSFYKRAQIVTGAAATALAEEVTGDLSRAFRLDPFWLGRKTGEMIENEARFMHFLALRKDGYSAQNAIERVQRFLFDYDNLTETEREIFRTIVPWFCVPDDSEILTRDGWKTCDELIIGEEVLTMNVENDTLEWQSCQDKAIFPFAGKLAKFGTKRRPLRCTEDHKWIAETKPFMNVRGKYDYPTKRAVLPYNKLNTSHRLVTGARLAAGGSSLLTPEQARLLGWLVTDGTHRWRGNYCEAGIYQTPKKFLAEVITVAGGKPRKPNHADGTVYVPVRKERLEPLKPYLDKNQLIKVVTRLSLEAAEAMYDAMYKGDGLVALRQDGRGEQAFFAAQHKGVRDAFRVLAYMLGYQTSDSVRGSYVSRNRHMQIANCVREKENYVGRIWCPTTPNHTWVMRQGTNIVVTSNTWQKKNIGLQLSLLAEKPRVFNGYTRFFRAMQSEKNPERDMLERDLMPAMIRNEFGVSFPTATAPQFRRWLTGIDLPMQDLDRFWNGDLASTFKYQWLAQFGPLPEFGAALQDMVNFDEAKETGIDTGRKSYRMLEGLLSVPGGEPLAKWLGLRRAIDAYGRQVIVANPAKVRALALMTFIDRPVRDLSRFLEPEDSFISALTRNLTGVHFVEMDPAEALRFKKSMNEERVLNYLQNAQRQFERYNVGRSAGAKQ